MTSGCLTEWSEVEEDYLHLAQERVNRALLVEVTTHLFRSLCNPMDGFFLPMVDIYLNTRRIEPNDIVNKAINGLYREKLYAIMKKL